MMRFAGGARFTLLLTAFVLFVLISALGLGPVTRLVPIVVAAPTLAIMSYQLRQDQVKQDARDDRAAPSGRERAGFLWILLFPAMLPPLGFLTAIPVHTLLFLRIRGGESWPRAVVGAATTAVAIYSLSLLTSRPELIEVPIWNWLVG